MVMYCELTLQRQGNERHHYSECAMSLKGEKTSTTNANFAHKSFIEAEFSHGNGAKKTWLACQGYYYEDNPSDIDGATGRAEDVAERK